jgi:hypothetical protein
MLSYINVAMCDIEGHHSYAHFSWSQLKANQRFSKELMQKHCKVRNIIFEIH